MPFEFATSRPTIPVEISDEFQAEWNRLSSPGATRRGAARVAIAAAARNGEAVGISEEEAAAARQIASRPAEIGRDWVEAQQALLGPASYVELVGVVSRLAAIDAFHRALGLSLEPLPEPAAGDPTGRVDDRARPGPAWVPMIGAASIVGALSIVPAEMRAQESLHGPIYLPYEEMGNMDVDRGLHRSQMELVAGRVSALNECFY